MLIRSAMKPTTKIRFTEPQIALVTRAYPNCNLELSFEFDQAGKILIASVQSSTAGRRKFTARQTSATILQFPSGERTPRGVASMDCREDCCRP
jgi:hypothetical protein